MGKGAIIGIAIFLIILVIGGLFAYSYTQLSVSLNDVRFHSIDWTDLSWTTLLKLGLNTLSGNWLGAAFDLIDGVNLNLIFGLGNNGFLPVFIPDLSYDVSVNGVSVGKGNSNVNITINPGQTKEITSFQNIQKNSLSPAVYSIVDTNGVMDLKVKGTAYFKLLGLSIPIPFESSKQISIVDEIKKKLNSASQANQKESSYLTLSISDSTLYEGDVLSLNGRLTTSQGAGLSNASIVIKDEDSGTGDDVIATIRTDSAGNFRYSWSTRQMDPFDSVSEIYAIFEGSQNYDSARSKQFNVSIQEKSVDGMLDKIKSELEESSPSSGSQYTAPEYTPPQNTFKQTSLSLSVSDNVVNSGDVIFISGKLVDSSGRSLQNGSIYIKDEDTGSGDDDIAIVQTNSNGEYSYKWNAKKMDPFDKVVELYAVFEGTSNFGHSRSIQINVQVN